MATCVDLVSCVKYKLDVAAPARGLYLSQLFRGLRHYAETHADAWYILYAEPGVLRPEQIIEPYERTLNTMPKRERLKQQVLPLECEQVFFNRSLIALPDERHSESG